jgi:hypothetical protein
MMMRLYMPLMRVVSLTVVVLLLLSLLVLRCLSQQRRMPQFGLH